MPTAEEGKAGGMLGLPGTTGSEGNETLAGGVLRARAEGRRAAPQPHLFLNRAISVQPTPERLHPRVLPVFFRLRACFWRGGIPLHGARPLRPRDSLSPPLSPPPGDRLEIVREPKRRAHQALDELAAADGVRAAPSDSGGARRKPAHPLQRWTGEGWGHFDSACFCGAGGPGKAKERSR